MDAVGSSSSPPASTSSVVPGGISAPRPLPSPPRRATGHLLGQIAVRPCAAGRRVERDDRLPEGRRFREPYVPGHRRLVHLGAEVLADLELDLLGELRA